MPAEYSKYQEGVQIFTAENFWIFIDFSFAQVGKNLEKVRDRKGLKFERGKRAGGYGFTTHAAYCPLSSLI